MKIIKPESELVCILEGPTKGDLFNSLYNCYSENPVEVVFETEGEHVVQAKVTGIRHEDGSGNNFIIHAIYTVDDSRTEYNRIFYYNTHSRSGTIRI